MGLLLGLAGLAVAALGITHQVMPRTFSPAQRQQIMAWEVLKRWQSWPAGQIFPARVSYRVPGAVFGGGPDLRLAAQRAGIAGQARCHDATPAAIARVLAKSRCLAVLRATYDDETQTLAVTVGVAVLPSTAAARDAFRALPHGVSLRPSVTAVPFRHTLVARFANSRRQLSREWVSGPYLVLAAVGYADGRPWLPTGNDSYVRAEMMSLASGVGQSVASGLGAQPPQPHCPGSPGC